MKILNQSKSLKTKMNVNWLNSAEEDHFWMMWRFKFLKSKIFMNKIKITKNTKIMDLGCGNGILSNQIEKNSNIKIDRVDSNLETLKLNQNIKGRVICYNIKKREKKLKNYYDIIFLFDVLEHVKDDKKFLLNVLFHLKNNGYLIINVPSINLLYSKYDNAVGHVKRYNKKDFFDMKNKLGFKIEKIEYWGVLLLPFLILRKILMMASLGNSKNNIVKKGWETNKVLNIFMKYLMRIELYLFNKQVLGTSLMSVIKK